LKGVTDATAARIAHTLVDGLTRGDNPREIGRALAKEVNVSKARAQTIARTEIIRTHAEGQLAAFDQMGVTHVGVAAEWATAGDARVCPKCRPLNGVVMRVDEARGLLPRHPNCRCAWLPANVGEDDAGKQKKSKSAIQKAIDDSYRAGLAKGQSLEEQKKIDPWGAADKTIDKDRPRSIFNEEGDGMIGSDLQGKIDKLIVRSKLKTIFNAESYFATCERDKAGHCLPSGETDDHPTPKLPNPSDVTVIKNLPGSTHPKLVVDEVNGHQWVMKFGQSEERLRNEASADAAYRAAGIDTPHSGIVGSGSDTTKFSAYDKDANQDYGEWKSGRSPDEIQEMRKKIGKGFVMDCLLANWDVIGLSNDNILIKNGEPFRVDNGGALLYRALGAPKGDKFGSKVMELETMRNSSTNPTAADVFKHLTDDDIVKQIKDVVIHKDAILQSIHDDATAKIVAKRIGSLVDWANSKSKPTAAKPAAEPTASIPQASTSDHGIKSGFDLHVYVQTHKYAKSGYAPKYVDKFLPDKYVKALSDLNPDGIKDGMMRLPGTTVNRFNILKKIMPKGTVLVVPKPAKWTAVKKGVMVITPEGTSITTKADHPGEKVKGSTGVTHGKDLGKMSTAPDLTSGHIKWTHSLSSSQKYAVQNWKDVAALIRKTVADAAAKGVPLDHDSHAYHFVEALKKCPKYAGNLYRGINSKDYAQSIISQCMSAGIGGTWADVSPMGMSRKPDTSLDFAQGGLLLRVKAKTARPIELSDGHTNEAEVIGMPGTQYRILGIHHDAKVSGRYSPITVIELEEVK
jgi:SPP1 gp7 family putative phage head morphogenesis protein